MSANFKANSGQKGITLGGNTTTSDYESDDDNKIDNINDSFNQGSIKPYIYLLKKDEKQYLLNPIYSTLDKEEYLLF